MQFNTLSFFLFLPVVFIVHHFSPGRFRWLVLLVASFFFYSALNAPHLIAILVFITTITYFTGIWIDRNENANIRRYLLWGGCGVNVLTLAILKYLPFLTHNLNIFLNRYFPGTSFAISTTIIVIGASYFIFQAISYLVDVYLEVEKPELHFGYFALYMSFFPKLLQGPIERNGDLLPQLKQPYGFNNDNVSSGILLFSWGLFKKVVIADRLALFVNSIYSDVHSYTGLSLLLAIYFYSVQIYCDFSGYTDMALGTARLFNINLTQNFKSPYLATSIADFWRRWHISFSMWIFDYIFKPLQLWLRNMNKKGTAVALIVTFVLSGLWHGANWGFIIWGFSHGVIMSIAIMFRPVKNRIFKKLKIGNSAFLTAVQVMVTFNIVSLTWIFFRAESVMDAVYVISHIHIKLTEQIIGFISHSTFHNRIMLAGQSGLFFYINFIVIGILLISCYISKYELLKKYIFNGPTWLKFICYYIFIMTMLIGGVLFNNKFIYQNF